MDCPEILNAPCAKGVHSIIVRDAGTIVAFKEPHDQCTKGGGYELTVEVKDASGRVLPETKLKLGGGPNRKIPQWATKVKQSAPVLDDENVPRFGDTVKFVF